MTAAVDALVGDVWTLVTDLRGQQAYLERRVRGLGAAAGRLGEVALGSGVEESFCGRLEGLQDRLDVLPDLLDRSGELLDTARELTEIAVDFGVHKDPSCSSLCGNSEGTSVAGSSDPATPFGHDVAIVAGDVRDQARRVVTAERVRGSIAREIAACVTCLVGLLRGTTTDVPVLSDLASAVGDLAADHRELTQAASALNEAVAAVSATTPAGGGVS